MNYMAKTARYVKNITCLFLWVMGIHLDQKCDEVQRWMGENEREVRLIEHFFMLIVLILFVVLLYIAFTTMA